MKKAIIICIFIVALALMFPIRNYFKTDNNITISDYPTQLSKRKDTILITYVAWACACANWLPEPHLNNNYVSLDKMAEDCIFLEADKEEIKITDEYRNGCCDNRLRLIGSYYEDYGISRDYEKPTSEKPKKARVFRYSEIEVVKPYTIWDFSKKEPSTKIIK